jgi:hypothetical protein
MLTHFATDVSQDDVTILQLDMEHGVGQRLYDLALDLYSLFLCH